MFITTVIYNLEHQSLYPLYDISMFKSSHVPNK